MARVEITPEQFTLVQYDAGVIAGLAEELATKVGLPDDVPIHIEIDEELLPGVSFPVYRRVEARITLPFNAMGASGHQTVPVPIEELEAALALDAAANAAAEPVAEPAR